MLLRSSSMGKYIVTSKAAAIMRPGIRPAMIMSPTLVSAVTAWNTNITLGVVMLARLPPAATVPVAVVGRYPSLIIWVLVVWASVAAAAVDEPETAENPTPAAVHATPVPPGIRPNTARAAPKRELIMP